MVFLFDIDGVINKGDYFSVQYEKDFDIATDKFDDFFIKEFNPCATGQTDIKQILPQYFKKWNWTKSVDDFLEYWFKNDIKLDYNLINSINKAKKQGHTCILVSQQEVNRKNHLWFNEKLNEYFDDFYCTCDFGFLKSDVKFYNNVVEKLFKDNIIADLSEVVYWDDTLDFVKVARSANIKTIHFVKNEDILRVIL